MTTQSVSRAGFKFATKACIAKESKTKTYFSPPNDAPTLRARRLRDRITACDRALCRAEVRRAHSLSVLQLYPPCTAQAPPPARLTMHRRQHPARHRSRARRPVTVGLLAKALHHAPNACEADDDGDRHDRVARARIEARRVVATGTPIVAIARAARAVAFAAAIAQPWCDRRRPPRPPRPSSPSSPSPPTPSLHPLQLAHDDGVKEVDAVLLGVVDLLLGRWLEKSMKRGSRRLIAASSWATFALYWFRCARCSSSFFCRLSASA